MPHNELTESEPIAAAAVTKPIPSDMLQTRRGAGMTRSERFVLAVFNGGIVATVGATIFGVVAFVKGWL